jgi:cellulose synthase/poly-beta-1,6-N-acetylglucosamine synthase-like glycosyltransferase/exo-beta-1,3-glucanase (GH17 family)
MRLVVAAVALIACAHVGLWSLTSQTATAPDVHGPLASVSYTPQTDSSTSDNDRDNATEAEKRIDPALESRIRADLARIAPYTRMIRTYSVTKGGELVPAIADRYGLKVNLGIWLDKEVDENDPKYANNKQLLEQDKARYAKNKKRNDKEIATAIALAKQHRNVVGIVVGNETLFRGDLTVNLLIQKIQQVKREVSIPVTTGEIWSEWAPKQKDKLKPGEDGNEFSRLASSVDYIAAHILPYWEGVPHNGTVDDTFRWYDRLRDIHPGKRVVIAEFGWPSGGYNRRAAVPGRIEQAQVLRDFVSRADKMGIGYNIIEAIDQPWKTFEGSVGAYWGIFDSSLKAKFPWSGMIIDEDHWKLGVIAVLVGLLLSLPMFAMVGVTFAQALALGAAANVVGAWAATVFAYWQGSYFVTGTAIALGFGLMLLVPLVLIAMARIEEIASIALGRKPRRLISGTVVAPEGYAPKVSIHVPAYREPPEMLKQTLDALARLDYANFEVVVIINNTPEPEFWQPIEEHCRTLGERFKFLNLPKIEGFKAGALRIAMEHTAPDAEIIGVLDADYVVTSDWLKDLVPAFADPSVGIVQAPQDHRDGARSYMHRALNGEYAGFFDIGMIERNEVNAIIVHGTMCLMRRTAMAAAGGWSSDTICEDADLGLAIMELGWQTHYTNRRYGHGLLPDTFEQFKKQRHRWAYGGFQIIKKHWRRMFSDTTRLTREQKREFARGWLNWMGADSIGVLVAILNLIWVPVVAILGIAVPDKVLTLPIVAAFMVSVMHFVVLYRLKVPLPAGQMLGAMFAAMSVQWTVARAMGDGLIKDHLPFARTAKGGKPGKRVDFPAFWEAVIGGLLVAGALMVYGTNWEQVREINFFALALAIQSLPFLAAVVFASLEASRANDPDFWRGIEERFAERLLRRPTAVAKAPAENSVNMKVQ